MQRMFDDNLRAYHTPRLVASLSSPQPHYVHCVAYLDFDASHLHAHSLQLFAGHGGAQVCEQRMHFRGRGFETPRNADMEG